MTHFIKRWRAVWNPDMYHGWAMKKSYFEGWYFKIVDDTEGYALAFIPGISMDKNGNSHAFIQTIDGKKCTTEYHRFEASDFQASETDFNLKLGNNQFSNTHLKIDVPNIKGELTFENCTPWVKMLGAPGIMGWFSFMPFMECYHGVVSLNHTIKGNLNINGKDVDFSNGKGYIEKDWGISFPDAYIWLQSNHFNENTEGVSLIASVANIPFLGTHFIGYIVGFWFQEKLYRFATYTGAQMTAQLDDNHISLAFKDSKYRLEIDAIKAGTGSLISPINGEMTGKINESLQAVLNVRFYENNILKFEGKGRNAGLEAAGNVDILLTDKWRR
jgi:tocopherol cyclase